MITFKQSGSFKSTESFLKRNFSQDIKAVLDRSGAAGVAALAAATPVDSGLTAQSWAYETSITPRTVTITWTNSHIEDGVPIAIILQYGHGTGTGAYIQGRDYINPAIKPIFDNIANEVWGAVSFG